uniref:GST C-terminal domain-containing protein n=1 Tax=Polytomella parva TaxID=51329 RepID=A0A7S0VA80_9CHLO|mmetsp:Transcript_31386/g.56991  ORF Transcript_31386/g.56991 Transcript_31386/m.56991 type:complete len:361 (+) Transcript_31386:69-1151(+)
MYRAAFPFYRNVKYNPVPFAFTRNMSIRTAVDEVSKVGEFKRTASAYRNYIKKGSRFEPEANRYHLYVSLACPWACRCLAALYLKGLEGVIGVTSVHPTWQRTKLDDPKDEHHGWAFASESDPPKKSPNGFGSFDCRGCTPDTPNGANFVRDLYEKVGDTHGKYSVPILWDTREKTIVCNESQEIVRMFNAEFNDFAKNKEVDLYPQELVSEIDDINAWVYDGINNGVYRCGFATSQEAYDNAVSSLFSSLDRVEKLLSDGREFLVGGRLTEADIRLFVTLIRFDEVYVVYFKTNRKLIREFPHLKKYVTRLYQVPEVQKSVDMYHIKTHYFTSHPKLNHYAIVPSGSDYWWEAPLNESK